ncbi:hypothetical protein D5R81_03035 [Parashewanella spongiae]|uniref:Flagellar assembly protein FliH/Type III secretion system HrpE domain-containing protein n=1 Tax=Parashewanella spongiae TaxID=342950 RepID=A0A3A6U4A9_9GAMM|nr:hypothetical protein [Parashewanella spongiae]MCL1076958.1 hypothetical protein [Parashewanella spongiae]RJY18926.1 hypothetical protein D5R81_03035 [Parashewanella spongiae]
MNPFNIEILQCEIERDGDDFVSETQLAASAQLIDMEQKVKQRIQLSLKAAHQQREDAREQAQDIIEEAKKEADAKMLQWHAEAQAVAIQDAVDWVKDEASFTKAVLQELKPKISQQIGNVIRSWSQEVEIGPLVAERLSEEVINNLGDGEICLMVSEEDFESVSREFNDKFEVKIDSSLDSGDAELRSNALSAHIKLFEHLDLIINAFVSNKSTDVDEISELKNEAIDANVDQSEPVVEVDYSFNSEYEYENELDQGDNEAEGIEISEQ